MAGIFPNLGVLCSELFPTEIRATSSGIVRALSYVALMGNYKVFPMAVKSFGLHYVVYFYASITAVFTIWVFLTIRNTDRLSLIEIQDMHKKTDDAQEITSRNTDQIKEEEQGNEGNINAVELKIHHTHPEKLSVHQETETKEKEETFQTFVKTFM